jgi:tRNA (Thr-GGU) A37 N-methylase
MQSEQITINSIGIIHTPYNDINDMPIQALAAEAVKGHIESFLLEKVVLMNVLN